MERVHRTEALVVGAGPAGAALAFWLGEKGWDCILADKTRFPRRKPCAGCFSARSFPLLRSLGLEETVQGSGQLIRFVHVQTPRRSLLFDTARDPAGPLFYVFPRERFDHLLVERARAASVRVMEGVSVDRLLRGAGGVEGAAAGGVEIRARVTVVATGAAFRFLPLEARRSMRSYQTLIGWFENLADPDPVTTDSFSAPWLHGSGWIFPESGTRANVGIMVHEDRLRECKGNLRRLFEAYCQTPRARKRLQGARRVGRLQGSPIRYTLRPRGIHGDGFLMVGEANLLNHPLTGEGISQALRSARLAADVLQSAREAGSFDRDALASYSRGIEKRFRKNFLKAGFLRHWNDGPFRMNTTLKILQAQPGVKRWLEARFHRIVL